MKKEVGIVIFTLSVALSCFIYLNHLNSLNSTPGIVSPISKSFSIFSLFKSNPKPKAIVYGYLPYWSLENVHYIQLDKLTDIAYFGLYINEDGTFKKKVKQPNEDSGTEIEIDEPGYNNWRNNKVLTKLIEQAEREKVRFAITVIAHEDEASNKFLSCRDCWDVFIKNLDEEMKYHKVKHVNLNFEYAELVEGEQPKQYTEFVDYVNKHLDSIHKNSFVVATTFADSAVKPRISEIESLGKVSDALFIMAYDFHRPTSDNAGPVAPIDGIGVHAEYDINTMLKDYIAKVPQNKLIMGVPYYGYNWVVKEDKENAERVAGNDDIGFSQSQSYEAIMSTILELEEKPEIKWDELARSPYFTYVSPETKSTRQVYFDNMDSLKEKYKLAKSYDLGGIGIWALGYDGGYVELWDLLKAEFIDI